MTRRIRRTFLRLLVVLSFATLTVASCATPIAPHQSRTQIDVPASIPVTALAGVPALASLKQYYEIHDFKIGGSYQPDVPLTFDKGAASGQTLESLGAGPLRVSYIVAGTPQYGSDGKIINAVVISSYYSGDSSLMYNFWYAGQAKNSSAGGAIVGPGLLIDTNRFYAIFVDAIGLWGDSKPSDGLGSRFPQYSAFDCVQANYLLLRDHLNIGKIRLATGVSMGAMQTYAWAIMHPEYVDAIMPIEGAVSLVDDPVGRRLFELMSAAISSDPAWARTGGFYYNRPRSEWPIRGVMFGWSILSMTGITFDQQTKDGWDKAKETTFSWNDSASMGAGLKTYADQYDAYDLLYRNRLNTSFTVRAYLKTIRAKTLIVHISTDQWLRPSQATEARDAIVGSRLTIFSDPLAHYAAFKAPNMVRPEVDAFFRDIGLAASLTRAN